MFTVPAEIADIAFTNKAAVYDLLFRAASETMLTIAADPRHLGARIGITAVLHTWGSALTHHPHVHMIVPGGGISLDGTRWVSSQPAFLLPVHVLGKLFPLFSRPDRAPAASRLRLRDRARTPQASTAVPGHGATPALRGPEAGAYLSRYRPRRHLEPEPDRSEAASARRPRRRTPPHQSFGRFTPP